MSELVSLDLEPPPDLEPPARSVAQNAAAAAPVPETAPAPAAKRIQVHKAHVQDARNIFNLVNSLSGDGTLLRRSYAEICENVRDFTVAERTGTNGEPEFLGCGALHLYGPHLAEVRSIVVRPEAKGLGAGGLLLKALIAEAEEHTVESVCLFTRIPEFFDHFGFRVAERNAMPDKIYKDCQTCPRLYACDEVAMVRGPLPRVAVLGPNQLQHPELVESPLVQLQLSHSGNRR
jgi:amino-acid N-acetyltransferase